ERSLFPDPFEHRIRIGVELDVVRVVMDVVGGTDGHGIAFRENAISNTNAVQLLSTLSSVPRRVNDGSGLGRLYGPLNRCSPSSARTPPMKRLRRNGFRPRRRVHRARWG